VPTVATAVGGRFFWKDERDVYDTITGGWEYPEGLVSVLGATQNNSHDGTQIRIMGTEATLVLTFSTYTLVEEDAQPNWRYTTNVWPKAAREAFWKSKGMPLEQEPRRRQPREPKILRRYEPGEGRRQPWHMKHFIDRVRSREAPVQGVTMGNDAAITAHLANLAYETKRRIHWSREKGQVFAQRVLAPVRLGLVGFGARGTRLAAAAVGQAGVDVVAVADPYAGRRERAHEILGDAVVAAPDAAAVLGRSDVDAVLIATPDHLHAPLIQAALAGGKDVYCESPLTHTAEQGATLEQELAASDRVVMCSAGRVTTPLVQRARELIEEGRLGRVRLVAGSWHTGSALEAWLTPYPPDASPDTIDFATFLGPAPERPFDLARFFRWRRYWDYGTGLAGARFAPLLSAVHWLLGCGAPRRVQASGGVHRWRDGREVPDTLVASFDYEEGLNVTLSATQNGAGGERLRLIGTEGSLVIEGGELRLEPGPGAEPYSELGKTWPEHYREWFYMMHGLDPNGGPRDGPRVPRVAERYRPQQGGAAEPALEEFVRCVRSRRAPREGLSHALDVASALHLCNSAYRNDGRAAFPGIAGSSCPKARAS
jgi:predicted dehydrogenase